MKRYGLDSWESWKIMILTGPMIMSMSASIRVGGFIFVGLLRDFMLTRQEASWPLTVQTFFVQVAAPIVTVLTRWLSHLAILRIAAIVSSLSLILCYFAQDLLTLTLLFGVAHGSAQSVFFTCNNVILSGHFDKRRTTATGLSMTISASSMLFMPAIFSYCMAEYGTRGSILLLGAVSLNAYAIALAVSEYKYTGNEAKHELELTSNHEEPSAPANSGKTTPSSSSAHLQLPASASGAPIQRQRSRCVSSVSSIVDGTGSVACVELTPDRSAEEQATATVSEKGLDAPRESKTYSAALRSLLNVTFFVDALSYSVIFMTLTTFYQVVVDFTADKGLSNEISMWCFSTYCAGDLLFRGTAGFIVDSQLLSTAALITLGFAVQSAALTLFTLSTSAAGVLTACFLMGASNGARLCLFTIILIADFGLANLTYTFSFGNFINGFAGLSRPPLVGYFRDVLNDYNGLFLSYVGLNVIFTCIWAIRWLRSRKII